jgi:hypothetical protein
MTCSFKLVARSVRQEPCEPVYDVDAILDAAVEGVELAVVDALYDESLPVSGGDGLMDPVGMLN